MAVEIYKDSASAIYTNWLSIAWTLANAFSQSAHFDIIDSYTPHWWQNRPWNGPLPGTPLASYIGHRYKGDPIADNEVRPSGSGRPYKVWHDTNDLTRDGGWFVVECKTSIHAGLGVTLPKWQAKVQWGYSYWDDVSDPTGLIYPLKPGADYTGRSRRNMCWRFSPWGGWDKADVTPDFRPAGRAYPCSSQNHDQYLGHGGSGNDTRAYTVMGDGYFMRWHRRNINARDAMGLGGFIGDINPALPGTLPNPRCFLGSGGNIFELKTVGSHRVLCEESFNSGGSNWETSDIIGGVCFPDHNEDLIEEGFRVPTGWLIMENGLCIPNGQSPNLELDTFPYIPMPLTTKGMWFDVPPIRKGYGVGFTPVANKQWISTGEGYCSYLKWDGSTPLF